MATQAAPGTTVLVHPLLVRITHWINAVAIVIMIMSGWKIYNASPLFEFRFPRDITIGGWLGGAIQWHFAVMWLLVANGLAGGPRQIPTVDQQIREQLRAGKTDEQVKVDSDRDYYMTADEAKASAGKPATQE